MENENIVKIKEIIEKRLKELTKRSFDTNIDCDGDEGDEVQGSLLISLVYEHNDRSKLEIIALQDALNKIKKEEFGYCEECCCEIEYKRLFINPSARYCIKCAEFVEKEIKSYRRKL